MRKDYRYLVFGVAGGMCLASIFAFGLVASGVPDKATTTPDVTQPLAPADQQAHPLPSATPTPTNLWTITAQPTVILSPTATLTQLDYLETSGQLYFAGALSPDRQVLLYRSSVQYIARSPEESLDVAKRINGVEYGNPANTCGPLAFAIMRDAGLVGQDVIPHDFWLLNPWLPADRRRLVETLGEKNYDHYVFHEWLRDFDWNQFPLRAGDFLYIKSGGGGNFDHMLVVSRVDSDLRAYAVTNYQRPDGFIIDEVLLYDPKDLDAGIFAAWTARQNAELGSTGFGGFELWRPTFQ